MVNLTTCTDEPRVTKWEMGKVPKNGTNTKTETMFSRQHAFLMLFSGIPHLPTLLVGRPTQLIYISDIYLLSWRW